MAGTEQAHSEFILYIHNSSAMKLLIVLSVIACSYSAKLDRTYLPPNTAATAGGSPGSLTAPSGPGGFGSASGRGPTSGFQPLGPSGSNGPSAFGKPSSAGVFGFGKPSGPSGFGQSIQSDFVQSNQAGQASGPNNFGQAASGFSQQSAGFNQGGSYNQGAQPQNAFAGQGFPAQERAQAAADRNAEILKFENQNDGETFAYSFETSNGITAEESGVATNGVQAQGGYSYTGDDGQFYQVTYTADENGYLPQGDHLPTPPPIPEEILLSLEKNAAAAAAGIQEGAYNPDEDNDDSAQQYNAGAGRGPVAYDQPQGGQQGQQGSGFNQQGGAFNQQRPSQQGAFNQQGPNTDYPGTEAQGSSGQFNQGSQGFSGNRAPSGGSKNQDNGYEYNRPQPNAQVGGQAQGQFNRPSQGSAFSRPSGPAGPAQGAFGAQTYNKPEPQRPTGPTGSSQGSFGSQSYNRPGTQSRPQSYNQGTQPSGSAFPRPSGQTRPTQGSFPRPSSPSQGSIGTQYDQATQTGSQGSSGSFPRPSGASFNKGQQPSDTQGLVQAPYQYNRPGSQQGQSRPQAFGSQGSQGAQAGPQAFGSQGSQKPQGFSSQGFRGPQAFGSQGTQGPQSFGSQGSQRPQAFGSQGPQRPQGFQATQGPKGTPGRGQTFKGPQQPASFDEQDGYKY